MPFAKFVWLLADPDRFPARGEQIHQDFEPCATQPRCHSSEKGRIEQKEAAHCIRHFIPANEPADLRTKQAQPNPMRREFARISAAKRAAGDNDVELFNLDAFQHSWQKL